jgi:hypothetical protein
MLLLLLLLLLPPQRAEWTATLQCLTTIIAVKPERSHRSFTTLAALLLAADIGRQHWLVRIL